MTAPAETAARAEQLREELRFHNHRYYTLDAPLYDATTAKGYTVELRLSAGIDRF